MWPCHHDTFDKQEPQTERHTCAGSLSCNYATERLCSPPAVRKPVINAVWRNVTCILCWLWQWLCNCCDEAAKLLNNKTKNRRRSGIHCSETLTRGGTRWEFRAFDDCSLGLKLICQLWPCVWPVSDWLDNYLFTYRHKCCFFQLGGVLAVNRFEISM